MSAVVLQHGLIVTVVATGFYERLSCLDLALRAWLDLE
ncbi:hypothetical protein SynA18461_00515 [Synechococcus sp. A18-46.1]|nr:hypothetical protein SynA18461_00515 [Synechococcus sp. A18-46.1]